MADSAANNLVWIDCEMTGLDLASDKLIEVAVVVTDSQLNVLDPGLDVIIDVSSIKELGRRWFPRVYFAQPPKGLAHRALADILESIRELAYYRQTLFVPEPGPSSDQAQAAATDVVAAFAPLLAVDPEPAATPASSES